MLNIPVKAINASLKEPGNAAGIFRAVRQALAGQ